MHEIDSILLIAFGGPEKAEDVRPFLKRVSRGRNIPPERLEGVVRHYELMGGGSPFNKLTFQQAEALRRRLKELAMDRPVYVGMRNWHPFLHETLEQMRQDGRRRALGIILSAFQTEASWDRYLSDVAQAREQTGANTPEVCFARGCSTHPLYIQGTADMVQRTLSRILPDRRATTPIVFTAHSIPTAMADASPYVAQFTDASRAVAERIGHQHWQIAYQSRSGSPDQPWLEPDICTLLPGFVNEGSRDVVVVPLGFVCDHVEVLFDLDIEAHNVAVKLGLEMHRVPAANDQPYFIAMLAELVQKELSSE